MNLRYSRQLHNVDWEKVVRQELPFLNDHRWNNILHVAGRYSINPGVLIVKLLLENEYGSSSMLKSDYEFLSDLKEFANDLARLDEDFYMDTEKKETSMPEYSLRRTFKDDQESLYDFLVKYERLHTEHNITTLVVSKNTTVSKRSSNGKGIDLWFPFPSSQCWQISPTHPGSLQINDYSQKYIMSSLDLAPSLFMKWGVPFDFLRSRGEVTAAHGGWVKIHSSCSLEIMHESGESSYYSHMNVDNKLKNGTTVVQGEQIGTISTDPTHANCNCDYGIERRECSTGPHVHWELRNSSGRASSLDGRIISGYKVKV